MAFASTLGLDLGSSAPGFRELPGVDGGRYSLSSFDGAPVLVIVFASNGCPTVRAYEDRLIRLHETYAERGVQLVAINSNDPHLSPFDTLDEMVARANERGLGYPYLKDADGSVARAFGAVCTPHVFVFDGERRLRYQGRIDDARVAETVESPDLENAIGDLLAGRTVVVPATRPFGCAIVW